MSSGSVAIANDRSAKPVARSGRNCVKRTHKSPCCHCEKRSDDLSAKALATAEALHLKSQLDCRSRQGSSAMTSQVHTFSAVARLRQLFLRGPPPAGSLRLS